MNRNVLQEKLKSQEKQREQKVRKILLLLLCLLLGMTGCSDPAYGEEDRQEISASLSNVGAGRPSGDRRNLEAEPDQTEAEEADEIKRDQAPEETGETKPDRTPEETDGTVDRVPGDGQAADTDAEKEELEIHFLDVGQGDSTLLVCGGEAMLIDAGNNDQGTRIQNYLEKQNVDTLKYVICTHPDADHIGGMDVILYKFECETVFMTDEEKDTNTYRDVVDAMREKGYKSTFPVAGDRYFLGDAEFVIVGPVSEDSGRESGTEAGKSRINGNNNSIAILVIHGENRFLFTGDAEEEEEAEMVQGLIPLKADVYKAGHHGSRTSSSETLLDAVQPAYAVVSCGEGNLYGHPHAETLTNLRTRGVKLYRTDGQGSIVLTSDGQALYWNCSPSEDWKPGEPSGSAGDPEQGSVSGAAVRGAAESMESGESSSGEPDRESVPGTSGDISYICNINTMKFHYPDCPSVEQMKESNKRPVSSTREELISQGFEPCKKCKP